MPTYFFKMKRKIVIETNRLILRSMQISDAKDYYEFAKLSNVGPNAGWEPHKSIKQTKEIIRQIIYRKPFYELPNLSIVLKEENKMIGTIELFNYQSFNSDTYNTAELGFALNPTYQNKGYMQEASASLIDYTFNNLLIDNIYTHILVKNTPSIKIMEKNNFKLIGRYDKAYLRYDGKELDYYYYLLTKEDYFYERKEN